MCARAELAIRPKPLAAGGEKRAVQPFGGSGIAHRFSLISDSIELSAPSITIDAQDGASGAGRR